MFESITSLSLQSLYSSPQITKSPYDPLSVASLFKQKNELINYLLVINIWIKENDSCVINFFFWVGA